jgi:hypothetical protein
MATMTSNRRRNILVALGAMVTVLFATACVADPTPRSASEVGQQPNYSAPALFRSIAVREADGLWPDRTLRDLLPNQTIRTAQGDTRTIAEGIVVGHVVRVEQGASYRIGENGLTEYLRAFGDPTADWRAITFDVAVRWSIGAMRSDVVTVGLTIGPADDFQVIAEELRSLPEVIIPVVDLGFYEFAPDARNVHRNGALLGVLEDGTITFPAFDGSDEYIDGLDTLSELEAASHASTEPIQFPPLEIRETD